LSIATLQAQSLPINFENNSVTTADFINFDGGTAAVIANPQSGTSNTSATVAQIIRDGGAIWAGSKIVLDANLNFSVNNSITMKVFVTAPIGTVIKFKLEGGGSSTERDAPTTVTNAWETLTWDFTGTPATFNEIVFMFDFGNTGNGSATSTFLFDDIAQLSGGTQIDWPVDFESSTVNYTLTPFEGNSAEVVIDPTNPSNHVGRSMKTAQASPSAGTTIGTNAGFITDLPFTLSDATMSVRVWSPTAGTPVRLKVEDSNDPTHTCETQVNTTMAGVWETLVFDFTDEAPGTESLSVGLSMGWTFNKASIFFNFGTGGSDQAVYYFDNVTFGDVMISVKELYTVAVDVFPNPSSDHWNLTSDNNTITKIEILDVQGRLLLQTMPNAETVQIAASDFGAGLYIARVMTDKGAGLVKLVKK
jgi:Secretion system C-terminal sorting domain